MGRLNVRKFTHAHNMRYITEAEFADIAALCAGNPLYYEYYGCPLLLWMRCTPTWRPCLPARASGTNITSAFSAGTDS
jgi:hypothetical protein